MGLSTTDPNEQGCLENKGLNNKGTLYVAPLRKEEKFFFPLRKEADTLKVPYFGWWNILRNHWRQLSSKELIRKKSMVKRLLPSSASAGFLAHKI